MDEKRYDPAKVRGADIPLECVSDGSAYDSRREQVRELRQRELSCKEIAERIGIPEGNVIIYCLQLGLPVTGPCWTMKLSPEDEAWLRYRRGVPDGRKCLVCGKILNQPNRGRKKKFCSDECRNKYWNDRWRESAEEHGREAVCENCGKTFYATNENKTQRRFCSRDCYFEYRYGVKGDERDGNEGNRSVPNL